MDFNFVQQTGVVGLFRKMGPLNLLAILETNKKQLGKNRKKFGKIELLRRVAKNDPVREIDTHENLEKTTQKSPMKRFFF